jgi:hypothetical protein
VSLIDLQRDMHAWLTREDEGAARRFGAGATAGLSVYLNNYRAQLMACIEGTFERMHAWIGDEEFRRAAAIHIERVPPTSWTLDAYGRDFPATLQILFPDDREIAELAWIDFALDEAFVSADAPALSADSVADVDWDRAVIRMTPSIDIAPLTTNATAIWSALVNGAQPPAVEYLREVGAILVWRHDGTSRFRAIDQYERHALLSIYAGMPFPELCRLMVELLGEEDGVARAGAMLGQWLGDGLIVGISQSPSL